MKGIIYKNNIEIRKGIGQPGQWFCDCHWKSMESCIE